MTALLLDGDRLLPFVRSPLAGGRDEKWLQALLFEQPALIPLDQMDPGAGGMMPICRELPLRKAGSTVFLDLLGVTAQGRLVLVECKLWRNPQARREVVAQILEYAALLRRWSYADLTACLKSALNWSGANPLFAQVAERTSLNEAAFVDAVSRSLRAGDFDLIIAGDGIRSDLEAIAGHLDGSTGRLALVEIQMWTDGAGRTLVVPTLPFRTEVIRQRGVVDPQGVPLRLEDEGGAKAESEAAANPERDISRAFWQRFIDMVQCDHPDQPPPRHGGNNWVRIALPPPAGWATAYRTTKEAGLFITLAEEEGRAVFDALETDGVGIKFRLLRQQECPFKGKIEITRPLGDFATDEELLTWLTDVANHMVTAFRPLLAALR